MEKFIQCVDCGDGMPVDHIDPRTPPLEEGKCLCTDCYSLATSEVLDESICEVENALQHCRSTLDHLKVEKVQELIDLVRNF